MIPDERPSALAATLRAAFGWDDVTVTPGPRGATARIWQVAVSDARYALKEGRGAAPSAASIDAELGFIDRATAARVRVPALHADRHGRRVVPGPDGTWLRLYDWLDTRPADLGAPATAEATGALLARLHRDAPMVTTEPDGSPPDAWYERPPALGDLEAMLPADAWWAPRLEARLGSLPDLVAIVAPVAPARLALCHRDLHPGNVVLDVAGDLVVLDQDDLGPADPARELARALFDWWSDPEPDLGMMRTLYRAYVAAGGPARVREPADFTMLLASRLNFLLKQLRVASHPAADPDDRAWAEQEIDESLRILPTRGQLGSVLAELAAT